jgi:outer membrane protein TolC
VRLRVVFAAAAVAAAPAAAQQPEPVPVTLTVEEAVRDALRRAVALRISRQDLDASAAGVRSARGAFDPQLAFTPALTRSDGTSLTAQGRFGADARTSDLSGSLAALLPSSTQLALSVDSKERVQDPLSTQKFRSEFDNSWTLSLSQPLLRGFGDAAGRAQLRAAEDGLAAAEARYARATEVLIANVELAVLTFAQRVAEEDVARQSLTRAETLLVRNEELLRLQRVTPLDVTTSRSGVAARRSQLLTARRNRENAADALLALVYGEEARERLRDVAPRLRVAPLPTEAFLDRPYDVPAMAVAESVAVARRPDVTAARTEVARQGRLRDVARNGLLPALGLSASYTALGLNTASAFQFDGARPDDFASTGWNAGLSFSYPLRNSRARAAAQQADVLTEQARLAVVSAENGARTDARGAHRGIVIGAEAHDQAATALALALEQFAGEQERQRLGLSDAFRLLQVEDQVSTAQLTEIAARFAYLGAITQFELAVGDALRRRFGLLPR